MTSDMEIAWACHRLDICSRCATRSVLSLEYWYPALDPPTPGIEVIS